MALAASTQYLRKWHDRLLLLVLKQYL